MGPRRRITHSWFGNGVDRKRFQIPKSPPQDGSETMAAKLPKSRLYRSQNTGRLVEADDDGGDVNEELVPGIDGFVGRVDVEHRSLFSSVRWRIVVSAYVNYRGEL